jgi:hypothetical protein
VRILTQGVDNEVGELDKWLVSSGFVRYGLPVSRDMFLKLCVLDDAGNFRAIFLDPVRGRVQDMMQEIIESPHIVAILEIIYQIGLVI